MNTPMTSCPSRLSSQAATEESTPPERPRMTRCFELMIGRALQGIRGVAHLKAVVPGWKRLVGCHPRRGSRRVRRMRPRRTSEKGRVRSPCPSLAAVWIAYRSGTRPGVLFRFLQRLLPLRRGLQFLGRALGGVERFLLLRRGGRLVGSLSLLLLQIH